MFSDVAAGTLTFQYLQFKHQQVTRMNSVSSETVNISGLNYKTRSRIFSSPSSLDSLQCFRPLKIKKSSVFFCACKVWGTFHSLESTGRALDLCYSTPQWQRFLFNTCFTLPYSCTWQPSDLATPRGSQELLTIDMYFFLLIREMLLPTHCPVLHQ